MTSLQFAYSSFFVGLVHVQSDEFNIIRFTEIAETWTRIERRSLAQQLSTYNGMFSVMYLPPANEITGDNVFTGLCLSTRVGGFRYSWFQVRFWGVELVSLGPF